MGKLDNKYSGKKIWVAGHQGFIGQELVHQLTNIGGTLITIKRQELNLCDKTAIITFLREQKPEMIINAAARVGGINANSSLPASFFYENLQISTNMIDAAWREDIPELVNLGSSCFYPKQSSQPITEEALLTGGLEPTNEGYALAKIAATKMCDFYRTQYGCNFSTAVPTNLYGPGDHFDPLRSHVVPAMIHKLHQAKIARHDEVCFWGTGNPLRQFLHVADAVSGLLFWLDHRDSSEIINIAGGKEATIRELAEMIASIVGYQGVIQFDSSHPDGMMRKSLCGKKLKNLGWQPKISFSDGLRKTYEYYLETQCNG